MEIYMTKLQGFQESTMLSGNFLLEVRTVDNFVFKFIVPNPHFLLACFDVRVSIIYIYVIYKIRF